ncbi:MAG TPA: acyl-CoA dehydrogenase family protein [Phycisphaerae bacterium]|nr:acyl-CoA dehydrogenase family protein [Phycisphaerae bacterium]
MARLESQQQGSSDSDTATAAEAIYPHAFSGGRPSAGADVYLREPLVRKLVEFFESKGLASIKEEDRHEQWYEDWIAYQGTHQLYARLLSPREHSRLGTEFDLLRYTRFLEVCGYFSPAHGYSLQVTFLGLCAILLGGNANLKREAIAALEAGGLLAFGVSERNHGSDLLGNEFTITEAGPGRFVAGGAKYYIGNSNSASIISILARKENARGTGHSRRAPIVLFALRPNESKGIGGARKIRTMGVRSAFVGEFEVKDHEFPESDMIAEGRQAWDAIFGTVTLGKFFLGFGSIGICEHAFAEAAAHLRGRMLYGKPAIEMPHIRATMAQAYARLTGMKLYAYRALDYVHASSAEDRRYLLFTAVQKAKLSTEGVKVMALLSECIGARGFESETYFEMALRDVQLIPGLEGSTHINLGLTTQFIPRYFADSQTALAVLPSLVAGEVTSQENAYLFEASTGSISAIAFPHFLNAYRPLITIGNVRLFAQAAKAFQLLARERDVSRTMRPDTPPTLAMGQCLATIAYAQLVAENVVRLNVPVPMVAAIFHALVNDFSAAVITLGSCSGSDVIRPDRFRRMIRVPRISDSECEFVSKQLAGILPSDWRQE